RGGIGCGGLLIVILLSVATGQDPLTLLGILQQNQPATQRVDVERAPGDRPDDVLADFVSVVLADTEDTWRPLFAARGLTYREPRLVLFDQAVQSACGYNSAAVGPFYCPADSQVYLDLSFFAQLSERFGAPGDFAAAYVVAHEVGHHVQNLLGIVDQVHAERRRVSRIDGNRLTVRMELQADCFAGIWGHHAQRQRDLLERGDIEEGLRAAAAIGDDTMQRRAQGYVQPETWTHGSSEQRASWFRRGLQYGTIEACDTFSARI
ncbi:MAG: neutral zinc metallopeptidase, partial [Acidobacteriota bacterium]